jgi:hypothetical protein
VVDPDWLVKDSWKENFTRAGRQDAGTLQEARGKSEGREKGWQE